MDAEAFQPDFLINSLAPIRICDNGGWTDTWFAGRGRIINIAISPYAEVQVVVRRNTDRPGRILIHAENYGQRYELPPGSPQREGSWGSQPLLEAAVAIMQLPEALSLEINIFSEAPAGASTGTSAAVSVALIGALDRLTPGRMSAYEVACTAHRVETELLGQQSGIQDQLCSAYGGINDIQMFDYPHCRVSPIRVADPVWWELEHRLSLVYLGRGHHSSLVHEKVIHSLEDEGPQSPRLEALRRTAGLSRDALYAGNFAALGAAMQANTEAQRRLHPDLVSAGADRIIAIAREYNAAGWKVNGAGGEGGSLTLLGSGRVAEQRAMLRAIEAENPAFRRIPIHLSRSGLRVWENRFEFKKD